MSTISLQARATCDSERPILAHRALLGILLGVAALLLTVTACGSKISAEPVPPVIHYGQDICEFCGMIISDERYAAGYITHDGQERIFDDVGGMFQAYLQRQDEVMAFFVHDYQEKTWIRAETAYYVLSEELPTPMLFGLTALDSLEKADALAVETEGRVLTFDQVLAHYRENSPVAATNGPAEPPHHDH